MTTDELLLKVTMIQNQTRKWPRSFTSSPIIAIAHGCDILCINVGDFYRVFYMGYVWDLYEILCVIYKGSSCSHFEFHM